MSSTTKRAANDTTRVPVPTDLNLFVLAECIAAAPGGILGRVAATHVPHIRRCIDAGLLEQAGTRGTWKLSAAGTDALNTRNEAWSRATPGSTR